MFTEQEKKELKQTIHANQHEVFVLSIEEMDAIIKSSTRIKQVSVKDSWEKIRKKAELGASYYASADDLRTMSKLVGELGSLGARVYVKNYGGKPHIILKGHPGLRKILTGTKYGIHNPKVVTLGLGKAGAVRAAKSGGIVSIVLLTTYRITDYFLTDQATLTQLFGALATDLVKIGIATGASIGAASAIAGVGLTLAVGPIVAVVVVGVLTSMALAALDERYGITDRVIAGLDEIVDGTTSYIEKAKQDVKNTVNDAVESVLDYTIDSARNFIINTALHHLDRFLLSRPKI